MTFFRSSDIRTQFLQFFKKAGHTVIRSSPLIPNDTTLLFANAGMVQFKDVFTGRQRLSFDRATSVQKCVRAGGKHNDLDNVGRTARHHTFFEMLGNFSFGDYFKEDAIRFAWKLLHEEFGLSKDRLWFTVFQGEDGIPADEDARRLWKSIVGVNDDRVIGLGKKENFWTMGDTGPQGPCSEIHFHQGDDLPCEEEFLGRRCLGPACDCDRFLEIWNLVFMQFERIHKEGDLLLLPEPSIDTGAGLERLTSVLQGKRSNYDTDLFSPLLDAASKASQKIYRHSDSDEDISMRVLADHARATAFLIADGVMPNNLGRGYVLRSIMRRAIRHAVRIQIPEGFFSDLCVAVTGSDLMGTAYPELGDARSLIEKTVNAEDEGFRRTLGRGMKLISEATDFRMDGNTKVMPGHLAFQLHDTYGFPLDLTQVIGREQGFVVDEAAFAEEMKKQRTRSKFSGSGDQVPSEMYKKIRDTYGPTIFTGYSYDYRKSGMGKVIAFLLPEGRLTEQAETGQEVEIFTEHTSFYGRSGGQVGDTGQIRCGAAIVRIFDTWKPLPDLIAHRGRVQSGVLQLGDYAVHTVDEDRHRAIQQNHSATHLLHSVLRRILGPHVTQKGSYVGPDKLTFDYSHFESLSVELKQQIEEAVNVSILKNVEQQVMETDFENARKLGAVALFGEKYGDKVRVMRLGDSIELCGGTHVGRTGDIGLFKITAESSIAKGVRRIEAVTGMAAVSFVQKMEQTVAHSIELLHVEPAEMTARIERLLEEGKQQEREIVMLKHKLLQHGAGFKKEWMLGDVKILVRKVDEVDGKALRELAETLREQHEAGVVVVGGALDEKVTLVVAIDKQLAKSGRFHAGTLVNQLAERVGGKGGGRPEVAQAGGTRPEKLEDALLQTIDILSADA